MYSSVYMWHSPFVHRYAILQNTQNSSQLAMTCCLLRSQLSIKMRFTRWQEIQVQGPFHWRFDVRN